MLSAVKSSRVCLARSGKRSPPCVAVIKPGSTMKPSTVVKASPRKISVITQATGARLSSSRPEKPYKNDQLTHSVVGEYDFTIFFLIWPLLLVLPALFPPIVLLLQWFHESNPSVFGAFL